MITRVVHTDSELGDFTYERDVSDPYKWHLTWPNASEPTVLLEGTNLLWDTAIATQEGVNT